MLLSVRSLRVSPIFSRVTALIGTFSLVVFLAPIACSGGDAPADPGPDGGLGDSGKTDGKAPEAGLDGGSLGSPDRIASGIGWTCARFANGALKCWGFNEDGELGLDDGDRGKFPGDLGDALPAVALGGKVKHFAGGSTQTCAVLEDGAVKCWGFNGSGQLGLGDTRDRGNAPGDMAALPAVPLAGRAIAVTGGAFHTCALLEGGTVQCWGSNGGGQLGFADRGDRADRGDGPGEMGAALPTVDLGGKKAVEIHAGAIYTCAILEDRSVFCWGANEHGQLGPKDRGVLDLGGKKATALAAGESHACAIFEDASVKCWGLNEKGQLGVGDLRSRGASASDMGAALPTVDLGGVGATVIAAGATHTCVILATGAVKCWGDSKYGQLGLGDPAGRGGKPGDMANLPTVDLDGKKATQLAAGAMHTCAFLEDATVKCWGNNLYGQLGIGDKQNRGDNAGEMGAALKSVDLGR